MRTLTLALPLILIACGDKSSDDTASSPVDGMDDDDDGQPVDDTGTDADDDTGEAEVVDADGDGWPEEEDCDDTDESIHPDADELCDEVDRNCDGDPTLDAVDGEVVTCLDEHVAELGYGQLEGADERVSQAITVIGRLGLCHLPQRCDGVGRPEPIEGPRPPMPQEELHGRLVALHCAG